MNLEIKESSHRKIIFKADKADLAILISLSTKQEQNPLKIYCFGG